MTRPALAESALTEALAGWVESLRPGRPCSSDRGDQAAAEILRRLGRHLEDASRPENPTSDLDPERKARLEQIQSEHEVLRRLFRNLDQGRQELPPEEVLGAARQLLAVLLGHLRREEQVQGFRLNSPGPGARPRPSGTEGFPAPRSFARTPVASRLGGSLS